MELDVMRDRDAVFSTELFRRYQRNKQAFVLSMTEMDIQGVSTRGIKKITETLCGTSISRSTVSSLNKEIDTNIAGWRKRRLRKSYPYLVVDARYEDIRKEGVVNSRAALIVIAISASGHREILAVDIGNSENEQEWSEIIRGLKSRSLRDVRYVVSDDHKGLVKALKREFQGAAWQRCYVHFIRNFTSKFSRKDSKEYVLKLKDIFAVPDIDQAREHNGKLVKELEMIKPVIAE